MNIKFKNELMYNKYLREQILLEIDIEIGICTLCRPFGHP